MVKLSGQIIATSSFGETWVNNNRSFTIPPVALVAAIFQVFFCKKEKSTTYLSRTDIKYPKHEILSRFMLRSVFPFHKVQFQKKESLRCVGSIVSGCFVTRWSSFGFRFQVSLSFLRAMTGESTELDGVQPISGVMQLPLNLGGRTFYDMIRYDMI